MTWRRFIWLPFAPLNWWLMGWSIRHFGVDFMLRCISLNLAILAGWRHDTEYRVERLERQPHSTPRA